MNVRHDLRLRSAAVRFKPCSRRGLCYGSRGRRRGVALAEMALVCPVLLLLACAAADFGRVIYAYAVLSNAARVGAEYGAMHGFTSYSQSSWQSQVQQAVVTEMQNLPGFQSGNLQVSVQTSTDSAGLAQVSVNVSYPFSTVSNWGGLPETVNLQHAVEMRRRQ